MVSPFGKGQNMYEEIQEAINRLESLQFDILMWKKREKSKKRKQMLADYDEWLDDVIEILYDFSLAE